MNMKKSFVLLELIIVIVILGVLATLGVMQYMGTTEQSRGAEARQILGQLRSKCAAIYMVEKDTASCDAGNLGIGADNAMIPDSCRPTQFFYYVVSNAGGDDIIFTATRCIAGGKIPNADKENTLRLDTDYSVGTDNWSSTGGY